MNCAKIFGEGGRAVRFVAVGDNCADVYLSPIRKTFPGGNAVNVSVYVKRGGVEASYVGAVGDDEHGRMILDALSSEGVDVSHVKVLPGPTGVTEIKVEGGERFFVHEDMGVQKGFRLDEETLDFVASHDFAYTTYYGGMEDYLPEFKRRGLKTGYDYSNLYTPELLERTLPFVDWAFFSMPSLSPEEVEGELRALQGRGPKLVVATMGKRGSIAFDGERFFRQPIVEVGEVVDTLGAGDAFIGTFIALLLRGRGIEEAMREAAEVAAKTCTHYGAWLSRTSSERR